MLTLAQFQKSITHPSCFPENNEGTQVARSLYLKGIGSEFLNMFSIGIRGHLLFLLEHTNKIRYIIESTVITHL